MKVAQIEGQRFGRLLVIERVIDKERSDKQHCTFWRCVCDCGNEVTVSLVHLKDGHTRSCGCLHDESAREHSTTHGMTKSRIHAVWNAMKGRCYNPNNPKYARYGGRGIKVCDEWLDFIGFYEWATSNGYDDTLGSEDCTIDRIDNDGNYEPSNCRWTTAKVQANNMSRNVVLTHNGETHTASEWCAIKCYQKRLIDGRLRNGWSVEDAIETPPRKVNHGN